MMWNNNKNTTSNDKGQLRHIRRDGTTTARTAKTSGGGYSAHSHNLSPIVRIVNGNNPNNTNNVNNSSVAGNSSMSIGTGNGSGAISGGGLVSKKTRRLRDFQSNVLGGMMGMGAAAGGGATSKKSSNSSPGFAWSRYNDHDNHATRQEEGGSNNRRNGTLNNNNTSNDIGGILFGNHKTTEASFPIIDDEQNQNNIGIIPSSSSPPTLQGALYKIITGILGRRNRSKSFVGVASLGILMAFALTFFSDRFSSSLDHYNGYTTNSYNQKQRSLTTFPKFVMDSALDVMEAIPVVSNVVIKMRRNNNNGSKKSGTTTEAVDPALVPRPDFVYEHPYVSSSYYTSTLSVKTLWSTDVLQVQPKLLVGGGGKSSSEREIKTRLAIVRPFCEFDAEALPTTFACWNALPPCKAAQDDIGDEEEEEEDYEDGRDGGWELGPNGEFIAYKNSTAGRNLYDKLGEHHYFDQVGSDAMKSATADVFLFYSQTFSENEVAIKAVDTIIDQFFEPGGWSQCFDNIYAIEANIPQELDLYIPSAQEELYNWVNGPNRQYEAAFRIIQSGEWGDYDGFYLMEGDSVPIKAHWLDVVLSEIEVHRPFAILGAQYDGDKWDNFYEKIPISLLHHTNGNAIYNTSHPLLERLVGQLEVEAPCPYNSIPYDYRMSQMWVEGTLGIVPQLAPKIMLNEEGENITLSNNTEMFNKWADIWEEEDPFKYTPVIHNYAATNLIPRHLGPEYIIHGAKLYSPWDPTKSEVTLVVSEWFFDRSLHLVQHLDDKDHPFSEVVIMVPPAAAAHDDYDLFTEVPVRTQHRGAPDFMDLCEADIKTDWFMITNSYHHVARHVDLMFTPGTFKPVIPFTPATYAFCFKYPYCKETINLAQRFNPGHDKVVQDMDMLYNTEMRNAYCKEWKELNGEEGEEMYKNQQRRLMFRKKIIGPPGPTGTSYYAWLIREGKDGLYKLTDRSLYGARPPFVKIFAKEEKLDGMSEDELAKRVGMTLMDNSTDCNCMGFETEMDCDESGIGCIWRPLFESCHPPELIDGSPPICTTTEAPTTAPTVSMDGLFDATESPTIAATDPEPESPPLYASFFKVHEHEQETSGADSFASDFADTLTMDDDDAILDPDGDSMVRKLQLASTDKYYETEHDTTRKLSLVSSNNFYEMNGTFVDRLFAQEESINEGLSIDQEESALPPKQCDLWGPSIVPRNSVEISITNQTLVLREAKLTSSATETRPRRLLSDDAFSSYSAQSPINLLKYEMKNAQSSSSNQNVGLATPISNNAGQLPSTYRTILNYGDKHPFEGAAFEAGVTFQSLRINFNTEEMTESWKATFETDADENNYNAQISAVINDILPAVSEVWSRALSVVPVVGEMLLSGVNGGKCGDADVPPMYMTSGVQNTDTLIFVTKDGPFCQEGTSSYASVCSFDQHMRPITGNLVICLNNVKVNDGIVSEEEILLQISSHTLEVGKILGLSSTLFEHYRNPATGRAWGSSSKTVTCVDGTVDTLDVPNVLDQNFYDDDEFSDDGVDGAYFEVTTPTVKQVIRNHFDCQTLKGARLENRATSFSCFGETFDERFHFDDDMTSSIQTSDKAFTISPLSLALLEDSSWYKADYSKATLPVFGRGAGCGFVKGRCMVDGRVPDYGVGFFCDKPDVAGCDYTHSHKATCDIGSDLSPSQDQCPMRTKNIVMCSDESNNPSFTFESFGSNSRCFETSESEAVCIQSFCNAANARVDLIVGGEVFECDYEGQLLTIEDHQIKCPRTAVVCPDLVCPANCSGKGMCDYCQEEPTCICDDPFDESPGCWSDFTI